MGMKTVFRIAVLTLVLHPVPAWAQDMDVSDCIVASIVLPLLGGQGDSPLIAARVNGEKAAFYVSPAFSRILVHDTADLWFPRGGDAPLMAQNGELIVTSRTGLDDLQLGELNFHGVPANLLEGPARHQINGLPIIGMLGLGGNVFDTTSILLDVPHRKIALLRFRGTAACRTAPERLMGPDAYGSDVSADGRMAVTIGHHSREMALDPDLSETVMPQSWANDAGVTPDELSHDPIVTTRYVGISVGRRHAVTNMDVGSHALPAFSVLFQSSLEKGAFGLPFFEHSAVLLDRQNAHVFVLPEEGKPLEAGHHLHFDESHQGQTAVSQKSGTIN